VASLSGGERARLLLAQLMIQGHAILVLDEPTNDLDLLTLRVLEQALLDFDGGALIVTHDRAFLDRVCTSLLVFEGDGRIEPYADRQQAERALAETVAVAPKRTAQSSTPKESHNRDRLTWKERKELEELPERLGYLESDKDALEQQLADPEIYRNSESLLTTTKSLDALGAKIEALYSRWEALDTRS
jgi:ATP-binding cassette subfamily F protein uup